MGRGALSCQSLLLIWPRGQTKQYLPSEELRCGQAEGTEGIKKTLGCGVC